MSMPSKSRCPRCGAEFVAGLGCPACVLVGAIADTQSQPSGPSEVETLAANAQEEAAPTPGAPPEFDNFEIIRELGRGGMGIVYLAEQVRPVRRKIALKVIKAGRDSADFLVRFEAERQALALMDHPAIARVYDAGVSRHGRPYFVMEYVDGVPITQYCDARRLSTRQRAELFRLVCLGVQHAHQKGVIHRDLKPSNILVAEQDGVPVPKIIDFGLAKAFGLKLTADTLVTEHGLLIGTPAYMSPEMANLDPSALDTRSDVYSLGLIFYELLVGELPFDTRMLANAAFGEMLRIIREEDPPRLSTRLSGVERAGDVARMRNTDLVSLRRELSGDLEWIVLRSLEKDPARRYASASEFGSDIQRHLQDEPVIARPPGLAYLGAKFLRRHRTTAIAAAAVLMALTIGLIASTTLYLKAEGERQRAESARSEAERQRVIADEQRRVAQVEQRSATESRQKAEQSAIAAENSALLAERNRLSAENETYHATISAAELHLRQNEYDEARERLVRAPAQNRGWEWSYLTARSDNTAARFFAGTDWAAYSGLNAASGEIDPSRTFGAAADGSEVYWHTDLAIHGVRTAEGKPGRVLAGIGRIVAIDSDASEAFTMSRLGDPSSGVVTEVSSKRQRWTAAHPAPILTARFSGNSQRLVTGDHAGNVIVWDNASGKRISHTKLAGPVRCLAIDPGGSRFVAATRSLDIGLYNAQTGRMEATLTGHSNFCRSSAFNADGTRVVTGSLDQTVRLWDAAGGKPLGVIFGHEGPVTAVSFNRDGSLILTGSTDRSVRGWRTGTLTPVFTFTGSANPVNCVAFTPDQMYALGGTYEGELLVWKLDPATTSVVRGEPVMAADLTGDGRTFAVLAGTPQSGVRLSLWDAATGVPLKANLADGKFRAVAISGDGKRVAIGHIDGMVEILDAAQGRLVTRLSGHKTAVIALTFSPDGSRLASGGTDGQLRLWNTGVGNEIAHANLGNQINYVRFSPDGRWLASASGTIFTPERNATAVRLWDGRTLAPKWELPFREEHERPGAWQVAFSPDGKQLAAGELFPRPRVCVWDVASGRLRRELRGHEGGVTGVAFSADGRRILGHSPVNGKLRVWDSATGDLELVLPAPRGQNYKWLSGPDGSAMYAVAPGRPIAVWSAAAKHDADALAALDRMQRAGVLYLDSGPWLARDTQVPRRARHVAERVAGGRVDGHHEFWEQVLAPNLREERTPADTARTYRLARAATLRTPYRNLAWDGLALAQCRMGQFDEALRSLERAESIAGEFDEFELLIRALALAKLSRVQPARESLQAARQVLAAPQRRVPPDLVSLAKEIEQMLPPK
jgi:eukaryotic-like serine/threonine-protein kinase